MDTDAEKQAKSDLIEAKEIGKKLGTFIRLQVLVLTSQAQKQGVGYTTTMSAITAGLGRELASSFAPLSGCMKEGVNVEEMIDSVLATIKRDALKECERFKEHMAKHPEVYGEG